MREKHDGDCTIYSALINGRPEDGICTCGYGLDYLRENSGDDKNLYSNELREKLEDKRARHPVNKESLELLNKMFGKINKNAS